MKYRKSGVLLSPDVFESLYIALIEKFEQKNDVSADTLMDYQLFGYGNYDSAQPNLKQFILEETKASVNGKYLYNKYLEWGKGNTTIKLTREFSFVYFNALGYKNITDFLKNAGLSEQKLKAQEFIESSLKAKIVDEYYMGYNQNNEGEITRSKLVISRHSQTVTWTLGFLENGILTEYVYPGLVKYQTNGMTFYFENTKNILDRSVLVGFYFDKSVKRLPYLIGSFSSFDRERKPVMGIVLYERKNDLAELENEFKNKEIDPRISRFIKGKRWATSSTMPQTLDDLPKESEYKESNHSPVNQTINQAPFYFFGIFKVFFEDQSNHYNMTIDKTGYVIFENDSFKYSGHAFISEGAILSIQITHCNQVPHSAQILAFVGRYPKDKIKWVKGSWHGLDETLTPSNKKAIIVNSDHVATDKQLKDIQKSNEKFSLLS